ncbi:hypothetical protein G7054_g14701 [Neopestalotiopsis clavispora]|nr:hypothetical protein G7054_g14701 [Neopestalotiopsis clavispora]
MPPRHQTLPSAQTASARAARQSFYCELCSKGYSRMNDYEAHLSSYDHSHRQRMRDMKQMVKDPTAAARARKAEQKSDGLISIKLGEGSASGSGGGGGGGASGGAGGGFKKGGFKKSGFKSAFGPAGGEDEKSTGDVAAKDTVKEKKIVGLQDESDTEDEGYEVYDPRKPTD